MNTVFICLYLEKNIKLLLLLNHAPTISEAALGWGLLAIQNP